MRDFDAVSIALGFVVGLLWPVARHIGFVIGQDIGHWIAS